MIIFPKVPWYLHLSPVSNTVATRSAAAPHGVHIEICSKHKLDGKIMNIKVLGIHTKATRTERHMYPSVHCSTVYNSQNMEAT